MIVLRASLLYNTVNEIRRTLVETADCAAQTRSLIGAYTSKGQSTHITKTENVGKASYSQKNPFLQVNFPWQNLAAKEGIVAAHLQTLLCTSSLS